MRIRLTWKFILTYIIMAVVCFILISTVGSRLVERSVISQRSLQLYNEAITISEDVNQGALSLQLFHARLRAIASYQGSRIWLLSNDGSIMLDSSQPYTEYGCGVVEGFDRVALGTGYYFTGTFFHYFDEEMLSVIVPVSFNMSPSGYLVIHQSMQDIRALRENILGTVHIVSVLIFLLCLALLVVMLIWVMLPLRKITYGAKEFASGNLNYKIGLKSGDEMQYLSDTLDYMASELNKSNDYQRDFIANVSHDFRSPLTSIKGYAQAIQDGTIPPELQNKYLGIIINEVNRLDKLSQEMLTVEQVDSGKRVINISVFDVNDMIRKTAASFEGVCKEKDILIDLVVEEEVLEVAADYSQIQQVLYNLLDNAIKFSKVHSTIEVATQERFSKAFIHVKDHGVGIASSEINKIWDRFYKADTSRGKDPRGSGLGLAIVREIIQNHGQKINVVSTPDVGTEFSFSLPLPDQRSVTPSKRDS